MSKENFIPSFSFEDQMAVISDIVNKIGKLELSIEQEKHFLAMKEKKLSEEFNELTKKEDELLKKYEVMLIEMGSKIQMIKELKSYIMSEREKCIKRYNSIDESQKSA
ncbi:hypothetical protein [Caloranaerobacter sp. DY30410]|uniref:hypothetical protein n=1 Tax=Caloranaerobacter sp. DY30410 TaxID=3238305 RepID=UPI003D06706E